MQQRSTMTHVKHLVVVIGLVSIAYIIGCSESNSVDDNATPTASDVPNRARSQGNKANDDAGNHKIDFHRIENATDAGDWKVAMSSKGEFSVELPGGFNDFTQTAKTKKGNTGHFHTIGLTTPSGVKYSATGIEGADPTPASEFLKGCASGWQEIGNVVERRDLMLGGSPGYEVIIDDGITSASMRAYVVGELKYILIAEYPTRVAEKEQKNIDRFFDSFKPRPE
jgi:hypothetical protein